MHDHPCHKETPLIFRYKSGILCHACCYRMCKNYLVILYHERSLRNLYSLLLFVAKNRDLFQANFDVHSVGTRYKNDLHLPPARLKVFQQGTFYLGIRAYNHLPKNIKDLLYDVKCFKKVLKAFFLTNSFYSLDKYFNSKFDVKVNSQL